MIHPQILRQDHNGASHRRKVDTPPLKGLPWNRRFLLRSYRKHRDLARALAVPRTGTRVNWRHRCVQPKHLKQIRPPAQSRPREPYPKRWHDSSQRLRRERNIREGRSERKSSRMGARSVAAKCKERIQSEMEMHIFTELVGIQMLLMNTLEPLLRGDKLAPEQLAILFRRVQTTKAAGSGTARKAKPE